MEINALVCLKGSSLVILNEFYLIYMINFIKLVFRIGNS